jgi:hypothetical protein
VTAKILPDDKPPFVTSVTGRIGEPHPKGRLVLIVEGILRA